MRSSGRRFPPAPEAASDQKVVGAPVVHRDDDAAAFAEAVRGVRQLRGAERVAPGVSRSAAGAVRAVRALGRGGVGSQPPPLAIGDGSGAGDHWSVRGNGVDGRVLRKLRGGGVRVDDRVDLHGLTRARAVAELERFLVAARAAGRRCVVVIHGRGLHSGDAGPALRDAVRAALAGGGVAKAILAACTAPPAQGGPGATLVLLRR